MMEEEVKQETEESTEKSVDTEEVSNDTENSSTEEGTETQIQENSTHEVDAGANEEASNAPTLSLLETEEKKRNWYAIHTYSGYENAVARNLKQRVESLGMEEKIFNVIVPTEKKIKIKGGKRKEVEERIYQGYVLVEMIYDPESWYVVRNTPRVTGFVGSGVIPVPLNQSEVDELFKIMGSDTVKHKIDLQIDESVRIIDGPFKDFEGKVGEVDEEKGKIRVLVSMFGRETPVELDYLQVSKI